MTRLQAVPEATQEFNSPLLNEEQRLQVLTEGGVEQHEGSALSWHNVLFKVNDGQEERVILDKCSGVAKPGQLLAILGGSGSGKTTLLNILCGRLKASKGSTLDTEIRVNGSLCTKAMYRRKFAYVMQDECLLPHLTVFETLSFVASLSLPKGVSHEVAVSRVNHVIASLGLSHARDTLVGANTGAVRGLSGGERRRVSVGVQLLRDPSVLLLDEPTTGLDSFTAFSLIEMLSSLATEGNRTIIFTIHQPRSGMLEKFNQVLLISEGQTAYLGPGSELEAHFMSANQPCPEYMNPLDFFVDLVTVDKRSESSQKESRDRVKGLVDFYTYSQVQEQVQDDLSAVSRSRAASLLSSSDGGEGGGGGKAEQNLSDVASSSFYVEMLAQEQEKREESAFQRDRVSVFYAIYLLVYRNMLQLRRDRQNLVSRLTQPFLFGLLLILFIIPGLGIGQSSVQDRMGIMWQVLGGSLFIGMLNSVTTFPRVRDLYYVEKRDGLYSTGSLLWGYVLHILPSSATAAVLFSLLLQFGAQLHWAWERMFALIGIVFCVHVYGELLGVTMMGLIFSPSLASSIASLALSFSIILSSGFLRSVTSLPEPLLWLSYASPAKFASELLVVNEYQGLELECDGPFGDLICLYPDGDTYLSMWFPEAVDNVVRNVVVLVSWLVFGMMHTYLVLRLHSVDTKRR